MRPYPDQWSRATYLVLFSALALAACQSPPPTAALNRARTAIDGAQLDGAERLAPAQLQSAQDKLASAQQAVARKDMGTAKNLAEEAEMQGIYADQTALAQKATTVAAGLERVQPTLQNVDFQTQPSAQPAPKKAKRRAKPQTQQQTQ